MQEGKGRKVVEARNSVAGLITETGECAVRHYGGESLCTSSTQDRCGSAHGEPINADPTAVDAWPGLDKIQGRGNVLLFQMAQ